MRSLVYSSAQLLGLRLAYPSASPLSQRHQHLQRSLALQQACPSASRLLLPSVLQLALEQSSASRLPLARVLWLAWVCSSASWSSQWTRAYSSYKTGSRNLHRSAENHPTPAKQPTGYHPECPDYIKRRNRMPLTARQAHSRQEYQQNACSSPCKEDGASRCYPGR